MKIAFVLDDSLDKPDGVQQYVLTVGDWLRTQGHEVHYLAGQSRRQDIRHVHSLSKLVKVKFNHNRLSTPLPADKAKIAKLLEIEKFDVLHVQMPYSPFLAGRIIAAAPPETTIVGTFHIMPYSRFDSLAGRLLGLYLRRNIKRIDQVVAVSPGAARFAKKTFKVKARVLPDAVSLHHYHHAKKIRKFDDGKVNIVFLGRLVERKGCLELLEAVQKLHKHSGLMNVRVIIAGTGPLKGKLEAYVRQHHLSASVHFLGFVNEADKPNLLASAHIAVFPSLAGEAFGMVLIEAMAAGAEVVIGGCNPGYRFVLDNRSEQLIKPKDTAAFARMLKHYITNGAARRRAHKWQEQRVANFDVAVIGKQLINIYKQQPRNHRTSRLSLMDK